ncbi:MAG: hypothetical protein ACYDEC_17120 [Bacteroidia bacterium]
MGCVFIMQPVFRDVNVGGKINTIGSINVGSALAVSGNAVFSGGIDAQNITFKGTTAGMGYVLPGNPIPTATLNAGNLVLAANTNVWGGLNVASLATGSGGLHPLYVDSLGNLKQSNIPPPCANCISFPIPQCDNGNAPWLTGGNYLGNVTGAVLGTCDKKDLVMEAYGTSRMWLKPSGMFGIGTNNPSGLVEIKTTASLPTDPSPFIISSTTQTQFSDGKLFEVKPNGSVYSREVFVQVSAFPDYVFKKGYKLMPLDELEIYLLKNHHLPNVPSTKEIEEKGAPLGELQRVSLEKTEELYLYVIEMNKKQEVQDKKIDALQKENTELKTKVKQLEDKVNK